MLELLLMLAIPRRDVKPLAKSLLRAFGSYEAVLSAPQMALDRVDGVGETTIAALKLAQASALRLMRAQVMDRPVLNSWDRLLGYLVADMAHAGIEHFRLLFLDNRNHLVADEIQQSGSITHTPVYPREVVKRALEVGATAVILVHNHPSGDPSPSKADIEMTREIVKATASVGVAVHDHLIIGKTATASFKAMGLLG